MVVPEYLIHCLKLQVYKMMKQFDLLMQHLWFQFYKLPGLVNLQKLGYHYKNLLLPQDFRLIISLFHLLDFFEFLFAQKFLDL